MKDDGAQKKNNMHAYMNVPIIENDGITGELFSSVRSDIVLIIVLFERRQRNPSEIASGCAHL